MDRYAVLCSELAAGPKRWLVTGAAGFIGSHLVEELLRLNQEVVGLDDFSTGRAQNLEAVEAAVSAAAWKRFVMHEGDIRDPGVCKRSMNGVDVVVHQAALGSVPRSIAEPRETHTVNVDGFVNIALAAMEAKVTGLSYASSSSVYGDSDRLPKREGEEGQPLSPYAASKRMNEVYAASLWSAYGLRAVGLRYFNVVGARQDPNGAYAAVVPKWLSALAQGEGIEIFGDGQTSRDFCPVKNVVQANLLAATAPDMACGRAFNIGLGQQTTLDTLYVTLRDALAARGRPCASLLPRYEPFRKGDPRHSLADVTAATESLGWTASVSLEDGIAATIDAFLAQEA